jgi:hypothetical protein
MNDGPDCYEILNGTGGYASDEHEAVDAGLSEEDADDEGEGYEADDANRGERGSAVEHYDTDNCGWKLIEGGEDSGPGPCRHPSQALRWSRTIITRTRGISRRVKMPVFTRLVRILNYVGDADDELMGVSIPAQSRIHRVFGR